MTSSSPEVLRGAATLTPLRTGELRTGTWTRLGQPGVLGDAVTESALVGLAESTRGAARAQGYAVGWAEGRRAADEEARTESAAASARSAQAEARREAEHQAALGGLRRAAEELREQAAATCAAVEAHASGLALELVEALLERELTLAEPGADAVRRALSLLPDGPLARVRMHPRDAAAAADPLHGRAVVVPDVSLSTGDVVVEASDHVVDGRISTAVARVREVLAR